ncbi:hypothetical protein RJ639_043794 [Escallonia herrerae]|uniref:Uncharacterized protein n=1 Tax=Escallonia herrerae TaxID=1293975 RepID=A0AA88WJ76_9ASTE|nr:hypothetical protein RJ639_043794 [Escallonia herrerae]
MAQLIEVDVVVVTVVELTRSLVFVSLWLRGGGSGSTVGVEVYVCGGSDQSVTCAKRALRRYGGGGVADLSDVEEKEKRVAFRETDNTVMIVHEIISEGIQVDEQMQVAAIIDKLPNSWKEFQKGIRHKQSELSIVNLMARLQIEEEARDQDKKNEAFANNTHANQANNHQGNGNTNGNGAKMCLSLRLARAWGEGQVGRYEFLEFTDAL